MHIKNLVRVSQLFGCRLETLLMTAVEQGYMKSNAINDMLRHKFWQCLNSKELKAQTRHKYDSIEDFDKLLAEIRKVEKQIEISPAQNEKQAYSDKSKQAHHHPQVTHQDLEQLEKKIDSKLDKVSKDLDSKIDDKLNKILTKLDSAQVSQSHQESGRGYYGRGRRPYRGGRNRGGYRGYRGGQGKQNSDQEGGAGRGKSQNDLNG